MVLGHSQLTSFSPAELEMVATETAIVIIPTFKMSSLQLIEQSRYGPFEPLKRTRVPIWLALLLKKKKRCRIIPPDWLAMEPLEDLLKAETDEEQFASVPPAYMEISRVLLEGAPDDIPNADGIRQVLKSLREVRQAKIREGYESLNASHLEMPNLTTLEINEFRDFFTKSFARLCELDPNKEEHVKNVELWEKDQVPFVRNLDLSIQDGADTRRDTSVRGGGRTDTDDQNRYTDGGFFDD